MKKIRKIINSLNIAICNKKGMELVQVAILIAIAIAIGIIFKTSITGFVTRVFGNLDAADF